MLTVYITEGDVYKMYTKSQPVIHSCCLSKVVGAGGNFFRAWAMYLVSLKPDSMYAAAITLRDRDNHLVKAGGTLLLLHWSFNVEGDHFKPVCVAKRCLCSTRKFPYICSIVLYSPYAKNTTNNTWNASVINQDTLKSWAYVHTLRIWLQVSAHSNLQTNPQLWIHNVWTYP